jgi:dephospho-CoA kinase
MKVIGLTGSIGMGKSTTSEMFAQLGVPIWDADSAVHRLYAPDGDGAKAVASLFPKAINQDGCVDRHVLAGQVLHDQAALKQLEAIVHPLVGQDRGVFLSNARENDHQLVIVDVPLLFETGGDKYVDQIIVVSCEASLQRQRVLARPGMSEEKFASILARQTPDAEKRGRADFVITTDLSLDDTRKQVRKVYDRLTAFADPKEGEL